MVTLVYTGPTTVVDRCRRSDITNRWKINQRFQPIIKDLNLSQGDETMFSYIARLKMTTQCLIEGTYLSTVTGGIARGQPIQLGIYSQSWIILMCFNLKISV